MITSMFKSRKKVLALALFAANWLGVCAAAVPQAQMPTQQAPSIYKKLAEYHLPSLALEEFQEEEAAQALAKENAEKLKQKQHTDVKVAGVGSVEKMRIFYDIFAMADKAEIYNPQPTLDDRVISDLELFCGPKDKPTKHVFNKIDRTSTCVGKIELQRILAQPTTNIALLERRQKAVASLVADPVLFAKVEKLIGEVAKVETDLAWFWKQFDQATRQYFDDAYVGVSEESSWVGKGINKVSPSINENDVLLQLVHSKQTVFDPALVLSLPYTAPLFGWLAMQIMASSFSPGGLKVNFGLAHDLVVAGYKGGIEGIKLFYSDDQVPFAAKATMTGILALGVGTYAWTVNKVVDNARKQHNVSTTIHEHMIPAGSYARLIDQFIPTIENNANLAPAFPEIAGIKSFNNAANEQTLELVRMLKTDTFKAPSSFFSLKGRVLASFKLMLNLKDHFANSLQALGKLDAYLSLARLYKEHEALNGTGKYCFVAYEQAATAHINVKNVWMPLLNPQNVVTNDIELGGTNPRNGIITGPNAGGKSTALKSLTVAILMALTTGMAPGTEMSMTPFACIRTHMNIADATGSASLFQAEMRRAQELLNTLKMLRPNEFAFVILDEIFTGTNPREGEAGAFGVAKKMTGDFPNLVGMFATHFLKLTELEQIMPDKVANYKVSVIRNPDGSFTFPYKLERGITNQAIALDLMGQEGFDADIIASAQGALAQNPRR